MLRFIVLLFGPAVFLLVHVIEGGQVQQLLQPAGFLLVVVVPIALGASRHKGELLDALVAGLSSEPLAPELALRQVGVLLSLRRAVLACTGLAMVLAVTHLLTFLDEPAVIAGGVGVTWVALFYGLGLTELLLARLITELPSVTLVSSINGGPKSPCASFAAWARSHSSTPRAKNMIRLVKTSLRNISTSSYHHARSSYLE